MLSILLPIYNFPCFTLAEELVAQASAIGLPFEMICMEDGSTCFREHNQAIGNLPHTRYIELSKNVGRSRIRNLLVSKARYDYVLLLDCDSKLPDTNYIRNYIQSIQHYPIVSGGTLYEPFPPADPACYLHWKYGSQREPKPDESQHKTFTSNNFIIRKAIIEQYPFNENIVRYGHEDSLFQMALEKHGLFVRFINNPVIHIGLETHTRFLAKTRESLMNLCDLYRMGHFNDLNINKIRLLKTYLRLQRYKLTPWIRLVYPAINLLNTKINSGKHPSLLFLDLYKLAYLASIFRLDHRKSGEIAQS